MKNDPRQLVRSICRRFGLSAKLLRSKRHRVYEFEHPTGFRFRATFATSASDRRANANGLMHVKRQLRSRGL